MLSLINTFAQQWYPMDSGMSNVFGNANVSSIYYFNGNIIAGGYFKYAGNVISRGVAQWDGSTWHSMGLGVWTNITGQINDSSGNGGGELLEFRGKLFTCGIFDGAGGSMVNDPQHKASDIARWDSVDWFPISPPPKPSGVNGSCGTMGKYNNNLYLGGVFGNAFDTSGNHMCYGIAKWNDTIFSSLGQFSGNFPPYNYHPALAFTEYNSKLIAGGYFTSIDGSPYGSYSGIAAWNDTTWSALGTGFNNAVFALTVFNGELYAGGKFTASGDNLTPLNHIAKWDGANWLPVGEGLNDTVTVLCVDSVNNKLIAGGKFTQTGLGQPAKHIAEWNGINWLEVGGGTNDAVWALYAKDSSLYVGGNFTQAGNITANCIAIWGENPVGINELTIDNGELKIYPNPVKDKLIVTSEKLTGHYSLTISNMLGQVVILSPFEGGRGMIDVSKLPKGVYFVNVNGSYAKFIKE